MSQARISALFMFVGFFFLISGGALAPPGVYRATQLADQLKIIAEYQSRWSTTNFVGALGVLSTATGFVILSLHLWGAQNKALLVLGTAAFVISGLAIALQSYLRVADPVAQLAGEAVLDQIGFYTLLIGVFIFGLIFLQAGYPAWLGYLSLGAAVLLGLGAAFSNLALAEVAYILPLIAGIVIWLSG